MFTKPILFYWFVCNEQTRTTAADVSVEILTKYCFSNTTLKSITTLKCNRENIIT